MLLSVHALYGWGCFFVKKDQENARLIATEMPKK